MRLLTMPALWQRARSRSIVDGSDVRVVNSAVYALMRFQEQMGGEGEKVGLFSEEDVESWITQSRRKENIV